MSNCKTVITTERENMMKKKSMALPFLFVILIAGAILGCSTMNRTQKGAAIGGAGGGVIGGVIGRSMGNTAMGAVIGAAAGGVTGAIIGRKMDKQAEEMAKEMGDAEVVREGEAIVIRFNEKVLFAYDQSSLNESAKLNLDKLRNTLLKYPETNIMVIGHTDNKGTKRYNQKLSERRANSVTAYTGQNGIDNSRFTAIGKGETDPIATNDTEEGSALNRRVEFVITANDKMKADANKEASL